MVPWVWLSGGGGTSPVGDHFASTVRGWEIVLAGAVAEGQGNEGSWWQGELGTRSVCGCHGVTQH